MPVTGSPSSPLVRVIAGIALAAFLVVVVIVLRPGTAPDGPPAQAPATAPPPAPEPEPVAPETATVSGTVTYRQRIALPPEAVVTVRLEDTSIADAAAPVVAETAFAVDGKQVPLPFEIVFSNASIVADRTYSVRATITIGGELRWTTTASYLVLTRGNPSQVDLVLDQVGAAPPEPLPADAARLRDTEWYLVEFDGRPVPPPVEGAREPMLVFQADRSALAVQGHCNRHFGTYEVAAGEAEGAAGTISVTLVGSTRMACAEPVMKDEADFLALLGRTRTFAVEGETLTLADGTGPTARFAARYSNK